MPSEVSICNQALGWLGSNLITSLDDESTEAALCKVNYEPLRDAVLEEAEWSFAIGRYVLPSTQDAPISGYVYAHTIPTDVLRVLNVREDVKAESDGRNPLDWVLEGENILCDVETIYVRTIDQVVDPSKFSSMFAQTLAARLAADLAIPLTESRSLQQQMYQLFTAKLSEAVTVDGMQGRTTKLRSPRFSRGNSYGTWAPPYV